MHLYHAPAHDEAAEGERRRYQSVNGLWNAVWDGFTASVFASDGTAIIRIEFRDDDAALVSLVAGSAGQGGVGDRRDDGRGAAARFRGSPLLNLVSDGCGYIFVGDRNRIRKIQLPTSMRAEAAAIGGATPGLVAGAAVEEEAVVTTFTTIVGIIEALAYVPGQDGGSLVIASLTALYRLPLGSGGAGLARELLAGREGEMGVVDGRGVEARFTRIRGLAVDADGCVLVLDSLTNVAAVRRVAPDRNVTTLATGLQGSFYGPTILPNGYLAMRSITANEVVVLDLGLKPAAAAPTAGPPQRTLPADLGALLDAQPDGTADLTILVGERSFAVHRLILSARCDYFKAEGMFADGSAAQLSLSDADPDAFALLLRYLYTGAADVPAELACAVAELADRLLLPELCAAAQAQVLAGATAETVAGALLWAVGCQTRGPGFSQLLSGLKGWYVENHEAVRREAPESRMRLMVAAPVLMAELMDAAEERAVERAVERERSAKRRRTQ